MRPPDIPSRAPSYAALFQEGAFAQRPMVDGRRLREAAAVRGLDLPLFPRRAVLEPLDRLGLLSPVGFRQTNYTVETTHLQPDPDSVVWREERHAEHWNLHAFALPWGDHPVLNELYVDWQLLYLPDVLDVSVYRFPATNAFSPDRSVNPPTDWIRARRHIAQNLDEAWRPTIKLLIALQSRFWAFRKNKVTLFHDPSSGELIDPVDRAIKTFDGLALLQRFGTSLDDLARLHWTLLEAAAKLDPTPHLQGLLALSARRQTDQLRGEGLRARDFYDAAFLLRRLYHDVTGDWLPATADESAITTVAQHRRRHLPRAQGGDPERRADLKELLSRAGLYPHALHIVLEGDTEELIVGRIIEMVGYQSDVQITNLGSVDEAKRHQSLFRAATAYASRTVLIADREGEIERVLRRFRREGILAGKDDVLLWGTRTNPMSFEEANFSYRQLVAALRAAARTHGGTLKMRPDDLRRRFAERIQLAADEGKPRPALANIAIGLAREPDHGSVTVTKGDLAPQLAEILHRQIKRHGTLQAAGKHQPLLRRLWVWLAAV